jgi:hypothetical protein
MNLNRNEKLKRNILEINLDFDDGVKTRINIDDVDKTLGKIGIDKKTDMEGYQMCPGNNRKIFVWLKESCNIQRFCKEESYVVKEGIKTGLMRPMDTKEVVVIIKGLNLNTPGSLVIAYLNKHAKVISDKVKYDRDSDGK